MSPVEFRRRYRGCLVQGYLAVLAILVQWYNITSVRFPPPPELYIWYPPQVVCACQCLLFSIKFILTIYSLPPMIFQIFSDFYWHPWILQKSKKHQHQHLHQLLPKPEWCYMTIMRPTITPFFFFFSFSPQPCSIDYGPSRILQWDLLILHIPHHKFRPGVASRERIQGMRVLKRHPRATRLRQHTTKRSSYHFLLW